MTTPSAELRERLDAGTRLADNRFHAAGIALLDFAGLLDHRVVHDHITVETVEDRAGAPVRAAWIEWPALSDAVDTDAIAGLHAVQHRLLRLAVSIAGGRPVDLREALSGLGGAHARAVTAAIVTATGLDGDVEITDTPAYLQHRRDHDAALAALLGEDRP